MRKLCAKLSLILGYNLRKIELNIGLGIFAQSRSQESSVNAVASGARQSLEEAPDGPSSTDRPRPSSLMRPLGDVWLLSPGLAGRIVKRLTSKALLTTSG